MGLTFFRPNFNIAAVPPETTPITRTHDSVRPPNHPRFSTAPRVPANWVRSHISIPSPPHPPRKILLRRARSLARPTDERTITRFANASLPRTDPPTTPTYAREKRQPKKNNAQPHTSLLERPPAVLALVCPRAARVLLVVPRGRPGPHDALHRPARAQGAGLRARPAHPHDVPRPLGSPEAGVGIRRLRQGKARQAVTAAEILQLGLGRGGIMKKGKKARKKKNVRNATARRNGDEMGKRRKGGRDHASSPNKRRGGRHKCPKRMRRNRGRMGG